MSQVKAFIDIIQKYPNHRQKKVDDILSEYEGKTLLHQLFTYLCHLIDTDNRVDDGQFEQIIKKDREKK